MVAACARRRLRDADAIVVAHRDLRQLVVVGRMVGRHPRFIHFHQHVAVAQRAQAVQLAVLADRTGDGVARAHQDQRIAGIVLPGGRRCGQLVRGRTELAIPDAAAVGQRLDLAAYRLHALAEQFEFQLRLCSRGCINAHFLYRRGGRGGQQLSQRRPLLADARLMTVTGSNNGAACAAAATDKPNTRPPAALPIDLDNIASLLE